MLHLKCDTDPAWVKNAIANLDAVLVDHAHCEHKAAITALSFATKYPDAPDFVVKLARLAEEEAGHYAQMAAICGARGLSLGFPDKDPYVKRLLKLCRTPPLEHRMDRLLVCAIIEARSCERLKLLAENIPDVALAETYDVLWRSEAGHHTLFTELATTAHERASGLSTAEARAVVKARLDEMMDVEAQILAELPVRAAIH